MIKPGIINGIRIPVDAVVEVRESDAKILIEDEMAFILENQEESTDENTKDKAEKKKKATPKSNKKPKGKGEVLDAEGETQPTGEVAEDSNT